MDNSTMDSSTKDNSKTDNSTMDSFTLNQETDSNEGDIEFYCEPHAQDAENFSNDEERESTYEIEVETPSEVSVFDFEYVDSNVQIAIVSFFFCCMLGISSIVKACESREYGKMGDYESAKLAATTARNVAIAAIVIGSVGITTLVLVTTVL